MMQGTDEWRLAKCGKLGASKVHEALARTKTGWGASRANLMATLIAERLTGVPQEGYVSSAMAWGTETEPLARAAYEFYSDRDVDLAGFIDHPSIPMSGCSPDGLVGKDGLIEVKCPETAKHIETLLGAPIDDKYIKQMQFQMAVTGRKWCHFVSFDPRLSGDLQFHMRLVERDDRMISDLEREVVIFLKDVAEKEERLRNLSRRSSIKDQLLASLEMEAAP